VYTAQHVNISNLLTGLYSIFVLQVQAI